MGMFVRSYIRFVANDVHPRSRRRLGVFRATGRLMHLGGLAPEEHELLEEELAWFNANLPVPPRPLFQGGRAICWFKTDAHSCIDRLWNIVWVLRANGIEVARIRTAHPGRLRYQDDFQVVAVPTPKRRGGGAILATAFLFLWPAPPRLA